MIRIVGESKKYIHNATCKNCSTDLEYTTSDILRQTGKDYSGGSDGFEYIICPRCQKYIILKAW